MHLGKRNVTPCGRPLATLCRVDSKWEHLASRPERLRWARHRAGFDRASDAARSLDIKPGTYRTYDADSADDGREPQLTESQRMARKFKVNWIWLVTGQGAPDDGQVVDERVQEINDKVAKLPKDRRDDALDAALGVINAFANKRR